MLMLQFALLTSVLTCVSVSVDLNTYLTRFQWDLAKYPIKQSLKNIQEIIGKVCTMLIIAYGK